MTYDEIIGRDWSEWSFKVVPCCISANREEQYIFELKRLIVQYDFRTGTFCNSYKYMDENGKWRTDETRYNMTLDYERKIAVYYRSPQTF